MQNLGGLIEFLIQPKLKLMELNNRVRKMFVLNFCEPNCWVLPRLTAGEYVHRTEIQVHLVQVMQIFLFFSLLLPISLSRCG